MIDHATVPRMHFSNKAVQKRPVGFATQDAAKIAGRQAESFLRPVKSPAHIIEDRALAGKQYESVNGVELFRFEADSDSFPQLDRKFGPFFLCESI